MNQNKELKVKLSDNEDGQDEEGSYQENSLDNQTNYIGSHGNQSLSLTLTDKGFHNGHNETDCDTDFVDIPVKILNFPDKLNENGNIPDEKVDSPEKRDIPSPVELPEDTTIPVSSIFPLAPDQPNETFQFITDDMNTVNLPKITESSTDTNMSEYEKSLETITSDRLVSETTFTVRNIKMELRNSPELEKVKPTASITVIASDIRREGLKWKEEEEKDKVDEEQREKMESGAIMAIENLIDSLNDEEEKMIEQEKVKIESVVRLEPKIESMVMPKSQPDMTMEQVMNYEVKSRSKIESTFNTESNVEAPVNIEPFVEAQMKVEPAKVKIEPAKVKIEPAKVKVEPAKVNVEPTKMKVEPARMNVELAKVKVEPAKVKVERRFHAKPVVANRHSEGDLRRAMLAELQQKTAGDRKPLRHSVGPVRHSTPLLGEVDEVQQQDHEIKEVKKSSVTMVLSTNNESGSDGLQRPSVCLKKPHLVVSSPELNPPIQTVAHSVVDSEGASTRVGWSDKVVEDDRGTANEYRHTSVGSIQLTSSASLPQDPVRPTGPATTTVATPPWLKQSTSQESQVSHSSVAKDAAAKAVLKRRSFNESEGSSATVRSAIRVQTHPTPEVGSGDTPTMGNLTTSIPGRNTSYLFYLVIMNCLFLF